jgi:hypothetical protein
MRVSKGSSLQCVVLRRYSHTNFTLGETMGSGDAIGDGQLIGIYCAPDGHQVLDGDIKSLLDGIREP